MKKILSLVAIIALSSTTLVFADAKSKANKDTEQYRYEIECAGNGTQGTYLVKVWSYSKKKDVAENQCRKNAVHGVIFKGYGAGVDNQCVAQRPLIQHAGAETENEDYFKSFFADGGEFQKYASIVAGTKETTKIKKEYKIGCVVSVRKDELRKALEAAGIIKSLGFGF